MAKNYVIDGGTGELDVGGNTLANRFDLPEAMVPQNLGQRFNLGGLVRQNYDKAGAVKQAIETDWPKIVKKWMHSIGVEDVSQYSTHSLRKSKPTVIYNRTKNVDAVRRLLGQSSVTATSAYLGVTDNSALELARNINI